MAPGEGSFYSCAGWTSTALKGLALWLKCGEFLDEAGNMYKFFQRKYLYENHI
jgi:hypothetical protein